MTYLLYGANGYTARLIIKESQRKGLKPILAGRNRQKIEKLARGLNLPFRVFDLNDPIVVQEALQGVPLCVNAAGPFVETALPLVKACLVSQTHYLDITGELEVFEQLKGMDQEIERVGIMVMPGVGFDVVPSDCLANYLKEKMPDAQSFELAFTARGGGISHGTATTMMSKLGEAGAVRRDGKLNRVPIAHKSKRIDFGDFSRTMATIPWGDVSTAYTSTGIPNIEVYASVPKKMIRLMKYQRWFNPILRTALVRKLGQWWIDRNLEGPTEEQHEKGRAYLHGMVSKASERRCARLSVPESYLLTALCTVKIAEKVLSQKFKTGYQTPAAVYGWRLILEIPETEMLDVSCEHY